jgi:formate-dependent nitrite reductase membrane component NrfD
MSPFVVIAIFAGLFAVVALGLGIASMAHGGDADRVNSNALMRARVGFHAIALLALFVAFLAGAFR